jgi:hypothetical protein
MILRSPAKGNVSSPKPSPQISNEAETMLNDLESSLAQFLSNNTSHITVLTRPPVTDEEPTRKSLPIIRSISKTHHGDHYENHESLMRVEWLDDAMQAERKKIIDEDERGTLSQPVIRNGQANTGQKRPLVDSNFDQSFNAKKSRI